MGRSAKSKQNRKAKRATDKKISKSLQTCSVNDLLMQADECMDTFNYDLAQTLLQRALEVEPDNLRVLEATGLLCLELGDADAAKHCFGRAVELLPNEGHSKYMYLGQLCEGSQAAEYFQKGIEIMTKTLQKQLNMGAAAKIENKITVRQISNAYLPIAEIYMTDCCFDEEAEQRCKQSIEKSLEFDVNNPEALQLKASFLLLKENKQEAREVIKKSVSLWLSQAKAAAEGQVKEDEFDPVEVVPLEYSTRISTSQILIEVEEYELANEVLEGLLDENDGVVQVWYMIGWLNYLQGEDYKGNARYYLQKAKELNRKNSCDDEPMIKHINELLDELGLAEENEEENGSDNDMEGDDIESDSDNEQMEAS